MIIKELFLENFRNYQQEQIKLIDGINIFYGENGQGKTNLLEGLYYLLTGKSYRVQREQELIRWGEKGFRLKGDFVVRDRLIRLESRYADRRKILKINDLSCRKLSEYVGTVNVIYFSPDDLILVKGGPGERRRFLDFHIAQTKTGHISLLNSYNKVLEQKRALLKSNISINTKKAQLTIWNEELVQFGIKIILNRSLLTQELQEASAHFYKHISEGREQMEIFYRPLGFNNHEEATSAFPQVLEENVEHEIERQTVLIGPHRDDLAILLNQKQARLFASQGQQRSLVLSLKLGEMELIKTKKGEYPLLLLDDVLSELDRFRRKYLLEFIYSSSIQTMITMTGAEEMPTGSLSRYAVRQGHVRREN